MIRSGGSQARRLREREEGKGEEDGEAFHGGRGRGLGGVARRGGVPPRRLRPGVAAAPLAGKRVHGAGSFAPSADSAWGAGAAERE